MFKDIHDDQNWNPHKPVYTQSYLSRRKNSSTLQFTWSLQWKFKCGPLCVRFAIFRHTTREWVDTIFSIYDQITDFQIFLLFFNCRRCWLQFFKLLSLKTKSMINAYHWCLAYHYEVSIQPHSGANGIRCNIQGSRSSILCASVLNAPSISSWFNLYISITAIYQRLRLFFYVFRIHVSVLIDSVKLYFT